MWDGKTDGRNVRRTEGRTEIITVSPPPFRRGMIKSSMRKHEMKNIFVQYFVDEIFNENALSLIVDVQSVSSLKELELKFQIRQLEIQEREKERNGKRERK